jgi:cytochrome P450
VQQIRDEVKTFVLAGHETSASMLAWTLYELHSQTGAKGDENIQKILAESNVVYKGCVDGSGRVVTMPARSVIAGDDVPANSEMRGLYYTECCLRESLRKYSIVPTVVRNCSEDVRVGPYVFEQGTKIMVNIQGAHHNAENWPEPQVYRPSRFSPEAMKTLKPMTFLPFIAGPRNCLGQFLSLLESKCVLSMLLQRYKFELTNPQTAGLKHPFMVPIIPEVGHHFTVKARNHA